jgi:hypothetical protein
VAAVLRDAATAGFEGHYWRYNVGMAYLLPFASWYFLCRLTDRSARGALDWAGTLIFGGLSIFASVISLQKAPLLIYLVTSFVVFLRRVLPGQLAVGGHSRALVPVPPSDSVFPVHWGDRVSLEQAVCRGAPAAANKSIRRSTSTSSPAAPSSMAWDCPTPAASCPSRQ